MESLGREILTSDFTSTERIPFQTIIAPANGDMVPNFAPSPITTQARTRVDALCSHAHFRRLAVLIHQTLWLTKRVLKEDAF